MKLIKKTSLEKSDSVKDTLDWKIKTLKDAGLPVESGLSDYIAQAIINLENEEKYLKDVSAQIKERREEIKSSIELIKVEGANFFKELGADKLFGSAFCSSISTVKGKESTESEHTKEVFNLLVDKKEADELLVALGKAEFKKVTEVVKINSIPSRLRVNKKKVADAEVIEEK